jgi:hypothetical protein
VEGDLALLLPARPPASASKVLEPILEPPAALQVARVSPRLWDVLVVEPCTIQLEECRVPIAIVQEHRSAVRGVIQMRIYLLILSDTSNGAISIGIILAAERGLDGSTKHSFLTKRVLLCFRSKLQHTTVNTAHRKFIIIIIIIIIRYYNSFHTN